MAEVVEIPSWRKGFAEAIGTFALVYIGVLAITLGVGGLVGIAFAHGLVLAALVSALMTISGGQFNPAVTVGLLVGRKISPAQAGINILAQLVGGLAGGFAANASLPTGMALGGVPDLAPTITVGQGILIEAIATFFLVIAVYGTAVDPRFGARLGGLAIGLTVAFDILAVGPLTGAAMNPARWFGAAVPASHYANFAVYIIGPLLGAAIAALIYQNLFLTPERPRSEPQAQMRAKDNM